MENKKIILNLLYLIVFIAIFYNLFKSEIGCQEERDCDCTYLSYKNPNVSSYEYSRDSLLFVTTMYMFRDSGDVYPYYDYTRYIERNDDKKHLDSVKFFIINTYYSPSKLRFFSIGATKRIEENVNRTMYLKYVYDTKFLIGYRNDTNETWRVFPHTQDELLGWSDSLDFVKGICCRYFGKYAFILDDKHSTYVWIDKKQPLDVKNVKHNMEFRNFINIDNPVFWADTTFYWVKGINRLPEKYWFEIKPSIAVDNIWRMYQESLDDIQNGRGSHYDSTNVSGYFTNGNLNYKYPDSILKLYGKK